MQWEDFVMDTKNINYLFISCQQRGRIICDIQEGNNLIINKDTYIITVTRYQSHGVISWCDARSLLGEIGLRKGYVTFMYYNDIFI